MRVACVVAALLHAGALSGIAADLESRITAAGVDVLVSGEPFYVEYALSNTGVEAVTVLSLDTPLEDSIRAPFLKFNGEVDVEYAGLVVKRIATTELSDFVTLQPGESISETLDLSEFYSFYSDGALEITAASVFRLANTAMEFAPLLTEFSNADSVLVVSSNALYVTVEQAVAKTEPDQESQLAPDYLSCSSSNIQAIEASIANAKTMMAVATAMMDGDFEMAYTEWFENTGSVTSSRYGEIRENMANIESEFTSESYRVDCSCTDNYYAYVYPSDSTHRIYVCNAFWSASQEAYRWDSKPGTLIHELSHFNNVAATDDHQYGRSGCLSLASSNPNQAINNADSHEYYCESNPSAGEILSTESPTIATESPTIATKSPTIESCHQCTDEPNGWMANNDKQCATFPWAWGNACNKKTSWVNNNFCQQTCFDNDVGYPGDNCCPTDTSCHQCTDEPSGWMANNEKQCATFSWAWAKACNKKTNWANGKFCQKTCFDKGVGYPDDNCCQ